MASLHTRSSSGPYQAQGHANRPIMVQIQWIEGRTDHSRHAATSLANAFEDRLGYEIAHITLPDENPQRDLGTEIDTALERHSRRERLEDPFIVYYIGGANRGPDPSKPCLQWTPITSPNQEASRRRVSMSSAPRIRWATDLRQNHLDRCTHDVLMILDCNHGNFSSSNQKPDSPILHTRKLDEGRLAGKLEILAPPQCSAPYVPGTYTEHLRNLVDSASISLNTNEIKRRLQPRFGSETLFLYCVEPQSNSGLIRLNLFREGSGAGHHDTRNGGSALNGVAPSGAGYGKMVLLPLMWADTVARNWSPEAELTALQAAFMQHFGFKAKAIYEIESAERLQEHIKKMTQELGAGDLFVVIYNGHGHNPDDHKGRMMISNGGGPGRPLVDWTAIVRTLDREAFDVVQILDCCFAAGGMKSPGARSTDDDNKREIDRVIHAVSDDTGPEDYRGLNEVLAACERDLQTPAGAESSMTFFTKILNELLGEDGHRGGLDIHEWWYRMDTRARDTKGKVSIPQRKVYPEKRHKESVYLRRPRLSTGG